MADSTSEQKGNVTTGASQELSVQTERPARIDGVVIGVVVGLSGDGKPLVAFPGNQSETAAEALSTTPIDTDAVGRDAALLFEQGDPRRPVLVGLIQHPTRPEQNMAKLSVPVRLDGESYLFTAEKEILLRCGKASITLTRAGKVIIRGDYVLSRSSGVNRIKGGSIQLN